METGESDLVIRRMLHDLRACVRALRDLPDWIKEDMAEAGLNLPEMTRESLDLLSENALRLDRYMIDLHSYARAGGTRTAGEVDVAAAWAQLTKDMEIPDRVQIDLDFQTAVLPVEAQDFAALLRILIENALRHHDRSDPHIRISTMQTGGCSRLVVEDDGAGIALEFHEKIFGFLEKLAARSAVPGSGVGLATARRLCSGHGGTIHVENAAPRGARFVSAFSRPD